MSSKRICIIPARGGSKRIPKKNIKVFLGKPIISYSIQAAIKSNLFDEIMVSTDDVAVSKVATYFGAKVPFYRSDKNSDDYATTIDVIIEVIQNYENQGYSFETGCCLYPSAPFVAANSLVTSFEMLEKGNFDCIFPVLEYSHPIQRALKINKVGMVEMIEPKNLSRRTQDLPTTYHDAGQFYTFNVNALIKKQKLLTDNTSAMVINQMEAHDIDNEEDWQVAEFKYQFTHQNI
jgi:N-acylneuraminate cytidylyltransferase